MAVSRKLRLQLLDSLIEIQARDTAALDRISDALSTARLPMGDCTGEIALEPALVLDVDCEDGHYTVALRRGSWAGLTLPPWDGPEAVVTSVVLWAVTHSRRFRVVHAGAVALNGAGILLPAPTYRGKTTFTSALVQRGYGLLSDEVGAIDVTTLQIHPFGRELVLRVDSLAALRLPPHLGRAWNDGCARLVTAAELGGTRVVCPVDLRLVVFLRYQPGAELAMEPLDARTALRWLFQLMPTQPHLGRPGFEASVGMVQERPCWRLRYSEIEPAVAAVRALL